MAQWLPLIAAIRSNQRTRTRCGCRWSNRQVRFDEAYSLRINLSHTTTLFRLSPSCFSESSKWIAIAASSRPSSRINQKSLDLASPRWASEEGAQAFKLCLSQRAGPKRAHRGPPSLPARPGHTRLIAKGGAWEEDWKSLLMGGGVRSSMKISWASSTCTDFGLSSITADDIRVRPLSATKA